MYWVAGQMVWAVTGRYAAVPGRYAAVSGRATRRCRAATQQPTHDGFHDVCRYVALRHYRCAKLFSETQTTCPDGDHSQTMNLNYRSCHRPRPGVPTPFPRERRFHLIT